jgi:hypothetical protein
LVVIQEGELRLSLLLTEFVLKVFVRDSQMNSYDHYSQARELAKLLARDGAASLSEEVLDESPRVF